MNTDNHFKDFTAHLGNPANPGLKTLEQRLAQIRPGENPYHSATALPADSPVFFGRRQEIHEICAELKKSKPAHVSLMGERRMGKSSLLNQVIKALEKTDKLITITGNAQHWNQAGQPGAFFRASSLCDLPRNPRLRGGR